METARRSADSVIVRFLLASGLIFTLLGLFGGLPAGANMGSFVIGLVVLFLAIVAFLGFGWYAIVKPLPANLAPSKKLPLSHALRQGMAIFLTIMSMVGVAGGLWDITWHVHSGIPFGEDFFWQPHQFIYAALFAPIAIAAFVWFRFMRNSSGIMRQRFNADVPVTLIFLGGLSMLFILPADPLWHLIYGEDLTGLSVPHFVFNVSTFLSLIGTLSILISYTPVRTQWESLFKIRGVELLMVSSLAFILISMLMPTIGDWEAIALQTHALPRLPALVAERPDWSMPFLAAFVAIFTTTIALRITKRVGTATLVWLIASVARSLLFLAFGYGDTGMNTMFLILPFVVAVDIAAWVRASRNKPPSAVLTAAIATVAGAVAVLPQIALSFTDPVLSAGNIPLMVVAMFGGALLSSWMSGVLGDAVVRTVRFEVPQEQPTIAASVMRAMSLFAVAIVGVAVFFMATATMPGGM
ncbi:MAG: hypothetical protein IPK19_40395 [Chloroflexi bacterium]|nr:hypothetical protein [Chloroflexota bacterium]